MKQKIIIYSVAIFISILLMGLGITFAYYSTTTSSGADSTVKVELSKQATLDFTSGDDFSLLAGLTNFSSGDENLYEKTISSVKLTATGDYTATYYVYFVINQNDFEYTSDEAELLLVITDPDDNKVTEINGLVYTTSDGLEGFDVTEENGVFEISIDTINTTDSSNTEYWTFELYFINLNSDQNDNASKTFDSEILLQAEAYGSDTESIFVEGSLSEAILLNNSTGGLIEEDISVAVKYIENRDTPDFSTTATTDEGLFAAVDDYGTSYYFRGATEDNYVEFADMMWRIIRIDGEGNIKLMLYNDEIDDKQLGYESIGTSSSSFAIYSDNVDLDLMDWYETYLESDFQRYLAQGTYCQIDDSSAYSIDDPVYYTDVYGYGGYAYVYKPFQNLVYSKTPLLTCSSKLSRYIGIISADEVAYAGGVRSALVNEYFYLYTTNAYWTESFAYISLYVYSPYGQIKSYDNFAFNSKLYLISTSIYLDIFPTISLDSFVEFDSGSGTIDDPYTIKM